MSLLAGLKPAEPQPCKMGRIIATLEEQDRVILENALSDFTNWTGAGLTKAINDRGIEVTRETLHAHRLGRCSCSKI